MGRARSACALGAAPLRAAVARPIASLADSADEAVKANEKASKVDPKIRDVIRLKPCPKPGQFPTGIPQQQRGHFMPHDNRLGVAYVLLRVPAPGLFVFVIG